MRKPRVENKYNLKPKDIEKATILNYKKLQQNPFWRNNVVEAWCLSGGISNSDYCAAEYWIGFYDKNAKAYAGKIRLKCSVMDGMFNYNFKNFFDHKEINSEHDLRLQEELLNRINWLIDEKIIEIK